jgi:predicted TPR repeat methyltransferase
VGHPIEQDGLTSALALALDRLRAGDGIGAEQALADAPDDDPRVLHLRAVAAHLEQRAGDAEELMARAVSRTADRAVVASQHNDLGNMRLESGRPAAAVEAYEASLELQPGDAPTWANLSTAHRLGGDTGRAATAALRALELDREGRLARSALAAALHALSSEGRDHEAREVVARWSELDPEHPGARHRLAALGGLPAPDRAPDEYVETLFDAVAREFDPHLAGLRYRAPELVADRLAQLVGEPGGSLAVVDVGCGTGLAGALLRPWASTLVGCDLSLGMLRRAQRRGCYDVLHKAELGTFLAAQHTAYDVVVSVDTLCYLGDLTEITTAARGALRPGGWLLATVEELDGTRGEPWRLTTSGRYAHAEAHLRDITVAAGLVDVQVGRVHLRLEAGLPVEGLLWSARRPLDG